MSRMPDSNPSPDDFNFLVSAAAGSDVAEIMRIAATSGLSHWSENEYHKEISRADSIFLKITDDTGRLCGFIIGRIIPGSIKNDEPDAEIYNIAVTPDARNRGAGTRLIKSFFDRCRGFSVQNIWLEVRAANASAREFYRKNGFSHFSMRRNFYNNPVEDAIVMKLSIDYEY